MRLTLAIVSVASLMLGTILELVRRRQLREKYALLWLSVGLIGLFFSVFRGVLDGMADLLGIQYGPSALFMLAIGFLMLVAAHLSWEVSRLEDKTRRLAEEIALMNARRPQDDEVAP